MSRKRKRGKSSSPANTTSDTNDVESTTKTAAAVTPVSEASTTSAKQQKRLSRAEAKRKARASAAKNNKGIRPWILPGIAGIAVIAVVLIGVGTLGSDDGGADVAQVPAPAVGEPTAQVVIHEYADFQCPFCGVFSRTIKPQLMERFIDRGVVRLEWHDFAWYGGESRAAANAARCAGEQDRFWEYHDLLFDRQQGTNQGTFSNDNLKRFGTILDLEPEAFESCVNENRYAAVIDAEMGQIRRLGLNGTPSFIIGDQRVVGAQPFEVFEQAVLTELQRQS